MWPWLCRQEKERAAAAAADAAEAQSAPAVDGKEAADKAAKKLEGNARYIGASIRVYSISQYDFASQNQVLARCVRLHCMCQASHSGQVFIVLQHAIYHNVLQHTPI